MSRTIEHLNIQCENHFFESGLRELFPETALETAAHTEGTVTLLILPGDTLSCLDRIAALMTSRSKGPIVVLGTALQTRLLYGLLERRIRLLPLERCMNRLVCIIERLSKQNHASPSSPLICETRLYKFIGQASGYYDGSGELQVTMNNNSGKYSLMRRTNVNNSNELHMKFLLAKKCIEQLNVRSRAISREKYSIKQKQILAESQVFKALSGTELARPFL
ncbi:hypothetical protein [Enterobacter cloacae]|uniref:hypothetical protein n=1 Tax=Enterobacter cloacae TaxID=550 RepID=UPI00115E461B|nr:hypothetical protein [Enterobacter cloacae]